MSRIPREVVDTIRDRVDIVDVVSRHVSLQRRSANYVGLCPFHNEKTPSFNVIPSRGIYHCFGCQAGGDVFDFMSKLEGLSFVEAVKELATSVGVEVPERELTEGERIAIRQRATLYEILEQAADFYAALLWTHSEGKQAREYLEERKLNHEIIKRATLGYAPAGWTRLLDHLQNKGYDPARCLEAGLIREGRQGKRYDTFRDRVVFPIRDGKRRIIGFGGRLMEGDGPKYINSPETSLYHKSKVLYGIEIARPAIQKKDEVLIVEGYFDVLALQQAGFNHAVACCGTALTNDHLAKIRRLTANAVMVTDTDEAGIRAAEKSLPLFLEYSIQPWRVDIPNAKDPDELIREHGPEAFEKALNQKKPLLEWVLQRSLTSAGGVLGRETIIQQLMPILTRLPPDLISAVAARLGLYEKALLERIDREIRSGSSKSRSAEVVPAEVIGWKPHRDISHIFWLLVHRYEQVADLLQKINPTIFRAHKPAQPAIARLISGESVASVIADTQENGVRKTLQAVVARETLYSIDQAPLAICQILNGLARPTYEVARGNLSQIISQMESEGKPEEMNTAIKKRAELKRLRNSIGKALKQADVLDSVRLLTNELEILEGIL